MCDDHSGVLITIPTASTHRPDGTPRPDGNKRGIDACIAPIVQALNDAGVGTAASCCGHGKRPGRITLRDGRDLVIRQTGACFRFDRNHLAEAFIRGLQRGADEPELAGDGDAMYQAFRDWQDTA